MKKIEIEEFKQIQLDILKEFANYCDNHNLRYYLGYGSLIGAIRHKGFIPWDDDIDIMMPRIDYEKFIFDFNTKTDKNLFLYSIYTDKKYIYPFAKLSNETTILVENVNRKQIGINIDIFPIDGLPNNEYFSKIHISFIWIFRKMLFWKLIKTRKEYKWYLKVILHLFQFLLFFIPFRSLSFILNFISKKYNFENSNFVAHKVWGYGNKERCRKVIYEDFTYVDFEGLKVKTVIGYDEFLSNIYGDYMKLPPENQRISLHSFLNIYWK